MSLQDFLGKLLLDFFIAFGVIFGAALLGGIGSVLTLQPPKAEMLRIATNFKIWAVVIVIGGTIDPIRYIESNLLVGAISPAIKQLLHIVSAFFGAYTASKLIEWICGGGMQP